MKKLMFPGSFDPFTYGHAWVVQQATALGHVDIVIATNPAKHYLLPVTERAALIRATLTAAGVEPASYTITDWPGLVATYARANAIAAIVKGVRTPSDFESETTQAEVNFQLGSIPTVFIPAKAGLQALSSTLVKQLASFGADITPWVAPAVAARLSSLQEGHHDDN